MRSLILLFALLLPVAGAELLLPLRDDAVWQQALDRALASAVPVEPNAAFGHYCQLADAASTRAATISPRPPCAALAADPEGDVMTSACGRGGG